MENLETIIFKYAGNGWYWKIDSNTGDKISFKNGLGSGTGFFREMKLWEESGNEIEPEYTDLELLKKEEQENIEALENQKNTCKSFLNESEIHVSNDPPYPEDVESWKNARKEWRKILKSDILQEIYPKPF